MARFTINQSSSPQTNNTQRSGGGIGFFGLLTIVLITLKLTGFITWSWIWVLAPLWMPIVLILLILFLVLMFFPDIDKN